MVILIAGPFLSNVLSYLEESINSTEKTRKLYIYSGHDINLVSLWRTFGYKELVDPEYGASLIIELHDSDDNTNFVKVKLEI